MTKGEIIVLLCARHDNIKIFNHRKLEQIEHIDVTSHFELAEKENLDIYDLNVIMHAPNAYQIYCRVRITDFSAWTMRGAIVMIEVFTDGPTVFV